MSKRLLGLDVGSWSVKVAFLDVKDGGTRGSDAERIANEIPGEPSADPTTTPAPEAAPAPEIDDALSPRALAIQALIARVTSGEDAIATAIPGTDAVTLHVDVPFSEKPKAASVLPHLLMDRLPVGIQEVVWDFQMQTREAQAEALVGFVRHQPMRAFLAEAHMAGIDPVRVMPPEHALAVALRTVHPHETAAVIDIGHTYTRLIVATPERIVLARTVMTAGRQITQSIAKAFKLPLDEAERIKHQYASIVAPSDAPNDQMRLMSEAITAPLKNLVREIRRSLQSTYAREKIEVPLLYITGGSTQIKGLDRLLEAELGLPVKRLRLNHDGSAMALGLLSSHEEKFASRMINLRQNEFAYRGRSEYVRRQMFVFAAAAVGIALALGAVLMIQKSSYEAQRDAMRETLQQRTQALFGQKLTRKKDIERIVAGDDANVATFVPKMSAYELMHQVTSKISPDIELKLTRFEVDIDRKVIQIMGETTDAQAVDRIVSDLETIECLKSIKKDKLKVKTDGKADFELQIATECS